MRMPPVGNPYGDGRLRGASVLGRKDRAYRYLKNTRSKRGKRNRKVDGREISTGHADT